MSKMKPLLLEGSCHCRRVRFSLTSAHPVPFNRCYCSICRKTAGGGGYAINLGGDADSLQVTGREHVTVYRAMLENESGQLTLSPAERHFCRHCASTLWVWDPRWPELVHPFAAAIDTPLPAAPDHTHLMLASRPAWVPLQPGPGDACFEQYPDESIAQWHARHGY